jgi:hypothetical protein
MPLKLEPSLQTTVTLEALVSMRQSLIEERDKLIRDIGTISDDIVTQLAAADQKSVRVGPWLVSLVESQGRQTLDKHRLVELGVAPETIVEATTRGAPSTSLQVRRASEE